MARARHPGRSRGLKRATDTTTGECVPDRLQPRHHEGCAGASNPALFPVSCRWSPIGSASGQPVAGHLAVVIDGIGLLRKGGPVVQAIGIDDGAGARSGLANGADINPAALADQELGGARAKAVELDQRPVCDADVDRAVGIAGSTRIVGATERATAGAQPRVCGRLREVQAEAEVAAVTPPCCSLNRSLRSPRRLPRLPQDRRSRRR